jgi:DNA-binding PadR family transcriptional regulator
MKSQATSSRFAILGLLTNCPMSGYQIRQLVKWSIGQFWSESYGQIYPALRALADAGLVMRQPEPKSAKKAKQGTNRRPRHVYAITEKGRRALAHWVSSPFHLQVPRNELLLKMFFGATVPVAETKAQIERFRQMQLKTQEVFAATEQRLLTEHAGNPQLPYWLMTLDYGQQENRAMLAWCDASLSTLNSLPPATRRKSTTTAVSA